MRALLQFILLMALGAGSVAAQGVPAQGFIFRGTGLPPGQEKTLGGDGPVVRWSILAQQSVPRGVPVPRQGGGVPNGLADDNSTYKASHYSDTQPSPSWTGVTVTRAANVVTASVSSDPTVAPRIVVNSAAFLTTALNCTDAGFNGNFMATAATASPAEVKWAQVGADTSTTCDVRAKALAMPAVGGTYTDPVFGTLVRRLSDNTHFYATKVPFNTTNRKFLDVGGFGSGMRVMNLADLNNPVQLCDMGGSGQQNWMWSRTLENTLYFQSGNQLRKKDTSTGSCTDSLVKTFSEYTSMMQNNEGDCAPGINDCKYIPMMGNISGGGQETFCYDHALDQKSAVVNVGSVFVDNVHCFSDGSSLLNLRGEAGIRILNVQWVSSTVMRVQADTVRLFGTDEIVVGRKIRVMGGQVHSATYAQSNGLWTICDSGTAGCSDPTTSVVYVTGSFPSNFGTLSNTGQAEQWEVYTERRGLVHYNSNGTLNNIAGIGSHGQVGEMTNGKKVWAGESARNGTNTALNPTGCSGVPGGFLIWVSKADWPADGGSDKESARCFVDGLLAAFAQGGHMSIFGNWAMYSMASCPNVGVAEASLGATWPTQWNRKYCIEALVRSLDLGPVYRVHHIRSRGGDDARCAFSQFKAGGAIPEFVVCNTSLTGSGTPSSLAVTLAP